MGTTKTDTQTAHYDPGSLGAFQKGTPAWSNQAIQFAQNPYSNPQFQLESQMGVRNAALQNQRNIGNVTQNQVASGFGGGATSPFVQEMINNMNRGGTANTATQGFFNPMQMANQRQQYSMGLLQGYHPLQTGQTDVQKTSGLGTWLPQVVGAGLGLATGGAGALAGGLGGLFNRGGGGGTQWANFGGNAPGLAGTGGNYASLPLGTQGNFGNLGGGGGSGFWSTPGSGTGAAGPDSWMSGFGAGGGQFGQGAPWSPYAGGGAAPGGGSLFNPSQGPMAPPPMGGGM